MERWMLNRVRECMPTRLFTWAAYNTRKYALLIVARLSVAGWHRGCAGLVSSDSSITQPRETMLTYEREREINQYGVGVSHGHEPRLTSSCNWKHA